LLAFWLLVTPTEALCQIAIVYIFLYKILYLCSAKNIYGAAYGWLT
jgi:hypothetical protein